MSREAPDKVAEAYRRPRADGDAKPRASEQPPVASELAYFPEQPRHSSSAGAMYVLLAPLFIGAGVAAVTSSAGYGLIAGAIVVVYVRYKKRQAKVVPRALLRVDRGELTLSGSGFGEGRSFGLHELLDVYLDTETIQRVQESPGPVPELRFLNATVGPPQETARIALEFRNDTVFLTDERTSHLDASEWFSKIRRFLRKQGWVPEDERPA